MKKTGQLLKEGREKLQLTISEISLATKINPRVLQAMEAGEMDKLPATSFLRGFIRSYATHLKLDGDLLLNQFNEELKAEATKPALETTVSPLTPETHADVVQANTEDQESINSSASRSWFHKIPPLRDSSLTTKSLSAVGIVLLILIIIGIRGLIKKYEKESTRGDTPEVLAVLPTPPPQATTPTPDSVKEPKKAEPPVAATPHEASTTPDPKPPDPKTPDSKTSETKNPEAKTPETNSKATVTEVTEKKEKPIESGPQEIILEALDKVELNFRIDEGPLKKIILQPEQIHTIKGTRSIAIDLSDGGAVNVIHNGRDKGVPGDLGKPKKLKYP